MLSDRNTLQFMFPHIEKIPVYNANGELLQEIVLPEEIIPIHGKRGGFSSSGLFYKGAGITYKGHFVNRPNANEKVIKSTNIIYEKYQVCYPKLLGKFGIFAFPHQPIFTDYEGACGKKEERLIINQKQFAFSAIQEIVDVIPTGLDNHNIYAYRLKEVKSDPLDVVKLIEYVLQNDYNTPWDKNLEADIYGNCYIRDIADWFSSDCLNHKIGTTYALLRAIYEKDIYLYVSVLKHFLNYYNSEKMFILYFSALVVKRCCPDTCVALKNMEIPTPENYEFLLRLLFSGKACCHLENEKDWLWVRDYYVNEITKYVSIYKVRCNCSV